MAEYIERETAMDIFGEGPMWTGYFEPYPLEVHLAIVGVAKLIREEIGKIPAADVAPVVRCQVCCFGQKDDIGVMHCHKYHCHKKADGFCDEGERMDGKGEDDGQKD